jgi:hypothetical protein
MTQEVLGAAVLVHLAGLLHVFGYLSKDKLVLRSLMLAGTVGYLLYYYFQPQPLWDAMFWSSLFIAANVFTMVRLVLDRRHLGLDEHERRLAAAFSSLTPGQFRRLMRAGKWMTAAGPTSITREGEAVEALFFVLDGSVTIHKGERSFPVEPGLFIGEIAWPLDTPASASVELGDGSRYVMWDATALRLLVSRSPDLRIGFESLLGQDLAAKVRNA